LSSFHYQQLTTKLVGVACTIMLKLVLLISVVLGATANGRLLLQATGGAATQQLPQFLLPPVPPQASAQVSALMSSIGGNVNAFANAISEANSTGGDTVVARAFADSIAQGNATALLNAIATATAFGRSDIANVTNGAYARAVADQVGRGNTAFASDAIAAALTLTGGSGPALATVRQLADIISSVGCTGPVADALRNATTLVVGNNAAYQGRGQTFAYSIAQQSGVSGCWTTVGGSAAGGLLASIQPVILVPLGPTASGAVPSGSVAPNTSGLPPSGSSGAEATPTPVAAGSTNVAAPNTQTPVPTPGATVGSSGGGAGSGVLPANASVAPALAPAEGITAAASQVPELTGTQGA
jgi:hypothetical protein